MDDRTLAARHIPLDRALLLKPGTKVPTVPRWQTGERQLARAEVEEHVARGGNLGFLTGEVEPGGDSAWVIDVDTGHLGHEDDHLLLRREYGELSAWRVHTAGGGWHYYVRGVPGFRKQFLPVPGTDRKFELFANGAQVVWPGSVVGGREYVAVDGWRKRLPEAPAWLIYLARTSTAASPPRASYDRPGERSDVRAWAERILGVETVEGKLPCPNREAHSDSTPSLHVYADHLRCFGCEVGLRSPEKLAAMKLGLGQQVGTSWDVGSHNRAAVEAHLAEVGL